jgi:hypothetical protein
MTEFIQLLFIGCFWIWGINMLFKKGEILGFIGGYLKERIKKFWLKPLFLCPACMSSVQGTLIYFSAHYLYQIDILESHLLLFWPFYCICLVGINHIIIEHLYDTTIQD